ncbi:hypothetical protein BY458DRAFT_591609 [Sporodiniella umbellata]|nr:hypothetical protein BY458DRAFT_591609 [Sporodiniella umbellata]
MSELIVYEDSPLDEYFRSINQAEISIKLDTVNLAKQSKYHHFTKRLNAVLRSFKTLLTNFSTNTFSTTLSEAEKTSFREELRDVIVNSSLLRELFVARCNDQSKFLLLERKIDNNRLLFSGAASSLILLLGLRKYTPNRSFLIALSSFASVSALLIYKRHQALSTRKFYEGILSNVLMFTKQCDLFDSRTCKIMAMIQEIELVFLGQHLSSSTSILSHTKYERYYLKCISLKKELAFAMIDLFTLVQEQIFQIACIKEQEKFFRLYETCRAFSKNTVSMDPFLNEKLSLVHLKEFAQSLHFLRRKYIMNILIRSESLNQNTWTKINDDLVGILQQIKRFTNVFKGVIETKVSEKTQDVQDLRIVGAQRPKSKLLFRSFVSSIQETRTIEAKLYLCNHYARQTEIQLNERKKQLVVTYTSLKAEIFDMMLEWESGKNALCSHLGLCTKKENPVSIATKSKNEDAGNSLSKSNLVLDCKDTGHILSLPSKAIIYESGVDIEGNAAATKPQKSRMERIAEKKQKSKRLADQRSREVSIDDVFMELKSALLKRNTDTSLSPK